MNKYIYKTLWKLIPVFLIPFMTLSCSDNLDYELFTKYTYLLKNGWQDNMVLTVNDDNTVDLNVAFGVNGTTSNKKDVVLSLGVDPDTLKNFNFDKYKNDSAAYYTLLPEDCYHFDKTSYTIPSGHLNSSALVTLDLSKLASDHNIYDQYVLPVKIVSSEGEAIGPSRYSKALYLINIQNKWSGFYSGSGILKASYDGDTYSKEVSGKQLYAISNNECYMYAGSYERDSEHHSEFVVKMKMNDDGNIIMFSPDHPDNFEPIKAYYTFKFTQNTTDSRKLNRLIVLYTHYKYIDAYGDIGISSCEYEGTLSKNDVVLKSDYPNAVISPD